MPPPKLYSCPKDAGQLATTPPVRAIPVCAVICYIQRKKKKKEAASHTEIMHACLNEPITIYMDNNPVAWLAVWVRKALALLGVYDHLCFFWNRVIECVIIEADHSSPPALYLLLLFFPLWGSNTDSPLSWAIFPYVVFIWLKEGEEKEKKNWHSQWLKFHDLSNFRVIIVRPETTTSGQQHRKSCRN